MKKLNILIENKCFTLMNKMFKIFFLLRNILYIYIYIFLRLLNINVLKTWPIFVFEKDRMVWIVWWWTKGHLVFSDYKDFCKNKASFPKIMHADQISWYILAQKPCSNETNTPFVLHTPFSVFSDWHGTFFKACYRGKSFCSSFAASMNHFWWLLKKKKKKLGIFFKFQ